MLPRGALGKHQSPPRPFILNWYVGSFLSLVLMDLVNGEAMRFGPYLVLGASFSTTQRKRRINSILCAHCLYPSISHAVHAISYVFSSFETLPFLRGLPGSMRIVHSKIVGVWQPFKHSFGCHGQRFGYCT